MGDEQRRNGTRQRHTPAAAEARGLGGLKLAIFHAVDPQTGKKLTQRKVARRAKIDETRLSQIIHRRGQPPTDTEQRSLSRVLDRPISVLFAANV